ncbi:DUF2182 domain-containing protein [Halobacteria archaeon AArc-m2/3/4]|uniref:DUF2182 domain-containing protein n=1 Tax=Natronoglomus mannanivorans TaxID=2979990 RepID=A0ABT2QHR1_9EURY|nr:DUF2182 domain-containing protein [Halobacteria archaeon AArc-m2/3/4]
MSEDSDSFCSDGIDLEIDSFPVATTATLSLAALLWVVLLEGWLPMPMAGVDAPMSAPGVPELIGTTNGLAGVGAYLLMWGTMMMAMMLPSLVPAVRRFSAELCGPIHRTLPPVVAFFGAYALAWTLTGVVPLAADTLVSIRSLAVGGGPLFVAALLTLAGAYQLTPLKRGLLERCRGCLGVCHRPTVTDGLRHGFGHAVRCIGCTWALFALMVGLGSMNALVMVGLTLVVSLERLAAESERYALATGAVLLAGAVLAIAVTVSGPFAV